MSDSGVSSQFENFIKRYLKEKNAYVVHLQVEDGYLLFPPLPAGIRGALARLGFLVNSEPLVRGDNHPAGDPTIGATRVNEEELSKFLAYTEGGVTQVNDAASSMTLRQLKNLMQQKAQTDRAGPQQL